MLYSAGVSSRHRRFWAALAAASCLTSLAACDASAVGLLVDLKTDLVPGRDFTGIRVEIATEDFAAGGSALRVQEQLARRADDFISGERIGEFDGLPRGTTHVQVTLLRAGDEVVARRRAVVEVQERVGITILITDSCRGVVCPGPADAPNLTECVGGACLDPRCLPESRERCGEAPSCDRDEQCTSPSVCGSPRCIDGACLVVLDDGACSPGETCDARLGCVGDPVDGGAPDAGVEDAGPSCAPSETDCADGVDEDCDGVVDCADPDCSARSCGAPTIGPWGACGGWTSTCGEAGTRSRTVTDALCSAGVCGTAERTQTEACSRDQTGVSCGGLTCDDWGACTGFATTCDEGGTQTRACTDARCAGGTCVLTGSTQTQPCTRDTGGVSCGMTTCGGWSSCNYASTCDQSASRTRTCTDHRCVSGTCTDPTRTETGACNRDTDGASCGSCNTCSGGSCRPFC